MKLQSHSGILECSPNEWLLLEVPNEEKPEVLVKRANNQPLGMLRDRDAREVLFNLEKGVRHLTLLRDVDAQNFGATLAVVVCPAGTAPEACRAYVNEQFLAEDHASESDMPAIQIRE